ncbi:MAG: glycoside hydrolase [Lentisphaerae bacterium]|jgi:endo-1,4-beta-xylanase|nr:glycoside hydrolase [Lentisphaerota bacterium]MBT4821968.1 glycoside hydrolase [Lentisphaerota bacterium]MBT5609166.1 glycoside hydrolase [Lentisphaerota bacterium]MBT7053630.1 glycoside hydrolase [Lentisphaerota bacterium]MBT7845711.1 glycoside hydrolase [Lentisphaerota bacterium]
MRRRSALMLMLVGSRLLAATPKPAEIPEGSTSLLGKTGPTWRFSSAGGGNAKMAVFDVAGMPFNQAIRLTHTLRPKQSWSIQAVTELNGNISKGDVCLMVFWVRSPESADESGDGVAAPFVQKNSAPHTKILRARITAGREWRQITLPFRSKLNLKMGASNGGFHLGFHPQTLEIGGFQLLNYGENTPLSALPRMKITYKGREPAAAWRQEARDRIEKHRKGNLAVTVLNADGTPAVEADVKVEMTRHAFGFGTALTARWLASDTPNGDAYREIVKSHYNKMVFENDLKWGPWKVSQDNKHRTFRKEWLDEALRWLQSNNIPARGHWLSWGSVTSGGQKQYVGKAAEHRHDLFAHIREKVGHVGTRVCEWDVINHPVGWGVTYEELHGSLDFHVDIFKLCREAIPKGIGLWINEGQILPGGGRRGDYERILRYLIEHGQTPDGIGFMGHFGTGSLTPIPEIYHVYDRYAKLVPNLQITEFDVNVGGDEQLQADYLRDFMTITFSHPHVNGIVMWGFWAGKHWKPEAALYRKDWSIKPAGKAWDDLVLNQWWTRETVRTDPAGHCTVRGFLGEYKITAKEGKREATTSVALSADGESCTVTLPAGK